MSVSDARGARASVMAGKTLCGSSLAVGKKRQTQPQLPLLTSGQGECMSVCVGV